MLAVEEELTGCASPKPMTTPHNHNLETYSYAQEHTVSFVVLSFK